MNNKLRYVSLAIFIALNTTPCFSDVATQTDALHALEAQASEGPQPSSPASKEETRTLQERLESLKDIALQKLPDYFPKIFTSEADKKSVEETGFTVEELEEIRQENQSEKESMKTLLQTEIDSHYANKKYHAQSHWKKYMGTGVTLSSLGYVAGIAQHFRQSHNPEFWDLLVTQTPLKKGSYQCLIISIAVPGALGLYRKIRWKQAHSKHSLASKQIGTLNSLLKEEKK